jgi:TPR repeat protein
MLYPEGFAMTTFAILGIAALMAAGTHGNPPEVQARAAAPITAAAASSLAGGRNAEDAGRVADAVRLYRESAGAGSGEAAKRLGDIYWKGAPGVERDLAESLRWYRVAEVRGEKVAQAVRLR